MAKTIPAIPVSSDKLSPKANQALGHLPGPKGHWLKGNLGDLTPNPQTFLRAMQAKHGDCFTVGFLLNQRAVLLLGPQANEAVLLDRENNFSNRWGWEVVHEFFGRNILVRDFEDHRNHRRLMTPVFKSGVMAQYLQQMTPCINSAIEGCVGMTDVYVATKQLALDIAVRVFAGLTETDELETWNRDLSTVLANVMAPRIRLPGTRYSKGLKARDRLRHRLVQEAACRRDCAGQDLFSLLVNQRDDEGRRLQTPDVVDHMFGILFAAHDTTASALAMMLAQLAQHPEWQTRARAEAECLYRQTGQLNLRWEDLEKLEVIEAIFRETLRLYAPIQFIPRRTVAEWRFDTHRIPANTWILLSPQVTHFDPAYYPNPDTFDPDRFLTGDPQPQVIPQFAFVPFGKGSHMCLGMHFAYMEVKAVLYRMLLTRQLAPADDQPIELEYLPIVRPSQSLRVNFIPQKTSAFVD